jgi:hypothetical protein
MKNLERMSALLARRRRRGAEMETLTPDDVRQALLQLRDAADPNAYRKIGGPEQLGRMIVGARRSLRDAARLGEDLATLRARVWADCESWLKVSGPSGGASRGEEAVRLATALFHRIDAHLAGREA